MVVFAGCDGGSGFGSDNFRNRYEAARSALEDGKYDKANRLYDALIDTAGPHAPRIRLEYSHSLLRAGDYDKASEQAAFLAQGQTGEARSAALSVYATAEHELALIALQQADLATGRHHLVTAKNAIDEVLKTHPDFDPLGALKTRQTDITNRLQSLG